MLETVQPYVASKLVDSLERVGFVQMHNNNKLTISGVIYNNNMMHNTIFMCKL